METALEVRWAELAGLGPAGADNRELYLLNIYSKFPLRNKYNLHLISELLSQAQWLSELVKQPVLLMANDLKFGSRTS